MVTKAVLACRTKVEMQAAAASSVRPLSSQDKSTQAGVNPYGEAEGQEGPSLPRWDCNDGDTWHKRQRVCSP